MMLSRAIFAIRDFRHATPFSPFFRRYRAITPADCLMIADYMLRHYAIFSPFAIVD